MVPFEFLIFYHSSVLSFSTEIMGIKSISCQNLYVSCAKMLFLVSLLFVAVKDRSLLLFKF